ncbi:MAG: UDP-N-acetylmuramoyl-L-alanyl-D-glutamate--2,6-diaminopimelate ligase [Candidatus Eisenbacteria bacterium]|nr:UDP-N-acetylmuramoyl-L-alanyl-D-glutamate--2,6-diaminopimelate ligase [Candidatus Eisenbacteria bacterium]
MKLQDLLSDLETKTVSGPDDVDVSHIAYDSRKVGPGAIFVCVSGLRSDGHKFVREAVSSGAVAVVVDRDVPVDDAVRIRVPDSRKALALLACSFHGHPSRKLKIAGITGTNGKTTVSYLVQSICSQAGLKAGVIGTVGYDVGDTKLKGSHTTPEAPEFQELLSRMVAQRISHAAVEVSSHALALRRSYGTKFDVVVFTNLTRDHLDFHGTFEDYRKAKLRLFDRAERGVSEKDRPTAVLNLDDPFSDALAEAVGEDIIGYSIDKDADLRARDVKLFPGGSTFSVIWKGQAFEVRLSLPGLFNVANALAAFGVGTSFGIEGHHAVRGLEAMKGVKGRLELVEKCQPFSVFVDYAHTPDALSNVLRTVRDITKGNLICVFGCGGERDKGKRSEMGRVSGALANYTVITSDNPRSEEPLSIITEIEEGMLAAGGCYETVPDRREAIGRAIARARQGDSVLIAGKGHEDYQILGDKVIHFDDREVVEEFLNGRSR